MVRRMKIEISRKGDALKKLEFMYDKKDGEYDDIKEVARRYLHV